MIKKYSQDFKNFDGSHAKLRNRKLLMKMNGHID